VVVGERKGDGGEEEKGKETGSDEQKQRFQGSGPLRKHPPLSHPPPENKENDFVWPPATVAVGNDLGPFLLHW